MPLVLAGPALAQDPTWLPNAASSDFNAGTNWTGGNAPQPGETAFFGFSVQTNLTTSADATVGGFTFNLGASNYTLTNADVLQFTGAGILISGGSLALTNDNLLTFSGASQAGSASITNNLDVDFFDASSAGSATISNDNTLRFHDTATAGNATITNTTFGFIQFSGSSTAGSAVIVNSGFLVFRDTSTAGNATIISDCCVQFMESSSAGNAIIANSGFLVFSDNSTAGQATITNDFMLVFEDSSTAGRATVTNNAAMVFDGSSTAANATITNNADLLFTGTSTAGSATLINNCCLVFEADSSAANATIITNNGASTYFFDNASGGNARFVVNAGGLLDISDLATAGTTAGSIEGAGAVSLGDKTLVVGGLNTDTTFSGVIDGLGGSLVKVGSGVLTLSGISIYTGPTTVDGGTLVVNGSLVSDVTVNSGAWLEGSGQIGGLTVMAGGVHAPGNSIGTQTVNGSYTNAGTLQIEVNAAGQSDLVIVTGGVDITGAILQVVAATGAYKLHQQYVIIQNDGAAAVVGNFAAVTSTLAFLTPSIVTDGGDGNDVVLTLTRNDASYASVAQTPNQRAVAVALDNGFKSDAGSDGETVINALLTLSAPDARAALDLMSGEIHASVAHVLFSQSRQLSSLASERLWQLGAGGSATPAALQLQQGSLMSLGMAPGEMHEAMSLSARADQGKRPRDSRVSAWVRGFGDLASIEADGNAGEIKSRSGGLIVGGDVPAAPGIVVGLMGGWTTSEAEVDSRVSKADIEGGHVAAYARAALGDLLLKGLASYSHHTLDVTRHIAFGGLARTARSDYAADQATVYGEAAWRWKLGGLGVVPLTALRWSQVDVGGFTEHGAGALDLSSDGAAFSTLDAIAGVRVGTAVSAGGLTWMPQARMLWTHSFGDVDPRLALGLEAGGAFVVSGVVRDRDVLTLGGGLNAALGEAAFGFVDYAAHLSETGREHALTAGLRVRF